jgi:hypothetical protein
VSATSQYTPIAPQFLSEKRTVFVLRRCTGRLGLYGFFELIRGFGIFPFPRFFLPSRR